ncbi:c-x8-c-x5-c-x3-h type zinc finger protein [Diplodia corticola]|uniref:C-x8-c-x5-c-x3-h type zinc finger protein n=1 Tax=Diplodia corticola TaxID=236234 RepID=A0A1J9QL29_9PEZI|nr:c-x8-c-x5-c-x3-h type zinc finger protein [Diplodia corticola]OJD29169.1 c-x8-c-x5-c-x3-h type zinc finger protein [Diplodia corticola]
MLRNTSTMITPPASPPTAAAATTTTTPAYKAYLRPTWFIQRDSGAYVPVIPVDELPASVNLAEAPRCLKDDGAQGMKFLGKLPFSGQTYSLVVKEQQEHKDTARDNSHHRSIRYPLQHRTYSQTSLRPLLLSEACSKPRAPPHPATTTNTNVDDAAPSRRDTPPDPRLPPSGREPDPAKKEYCTYWIRTGECDFTQQGCLFKHEMPDLRTLREKVGVGAVPHWWQMRCAMAERKKRVGEEKEKWVGEVPGWLVDKMGEVEEEDSSDDESVVGMVKSRATVPNTVGTTRVFRSPDHAVRTTRKEEAEEEGANAASHRLINDTIPSLPADTGRQRSQQQQRRSHALVSRFDDTASSSSPVSTPLPTPPTPTTPSISKRHHTSPATPRPHARSISDAQADIAHRLTTTHHHQVHHHRHRHSTTPTIPVPTPSPSARPRTHTHTRRREPLPTTTKRHTPSSALPQLKRHSSPLTTTTTTTSTCASPPPPRRSIIVTSASPLPAATGGRQQLVGLRASRHAVGGDDDDDVPSFEPAAVAVLGVRGPGGGGVGAGGGAGSAGGGAKRGKVRVAAAGSGAGATRVPVPMRVGGGMVVG